MKTRILAAGFAASVLLLLGAKPAAAAADLPGDARNFMRDAESAVEDVLPDSTAAPDATLGDTSGGAGDSTTTGDGQIEGTDSGSTDHGGNDSSSDTADGFLGDESDPMSEEATDTAQTSSGESKSSMSGMVWIAVIVLLAGAAAVLVFALNPRKR